MQHNLHSLNNNPYQYAQNTPASDKGNKVSLSLSDLVSSDYSMRKPKQSAQNETSVEYKQELATLLAKSRGTSYERTLKKFVESKYREIQADEEAKAQDDRTMRTSLASLSSSKYDSPHRMSAFDDSILNERKSRLEEMSKPMDRQSWKGPVVEVPRISTNHIGRQRPSPLKARPYELSSSSSSVSISSTGLLTSRSARERSPSPSTRDSTVVQKKSAAVSVQEFNKWLQTNKDWKRKHDENVAKIIEQDIRAAKEQARPKLHTKSFKLGESAKMKETERLFRSQSRDDLFSLSKEQSVDEGDMEEKSASDAHHTLLQSGRSESPNVYDRLGERGRQYAHLRMSWEPPSDQRSHTPVILDRSRRLSRSSELRCTNSASRLPDRSTSRERDNLERLQARSRETGDTSLTHKDFLRGSGLSKVGNVVPESEPSRQNSRLSTKSGHQEVSSLRLSDLLRTRSTSELTTNTVTNRLHHQSSQQLNNNTLQSGSRSVSRERSRPTDSVSVSALAISGIDKMRSASATKQRLETERENKRNYIRPETVTAEFAPTLVAPETARIMSRVTTTFEERTLKSVDTLFVARTVTKRVASPGPGQYPNAQTAAVSPYKTMREARSSSVRSASPTPRGPVNTAVIAATVLDRATLLGSPLVGSKGYSFGKQQLGRFSYAGAADDISLMYAKK